MHKEITDIKDVYVIVISIVFVVIVITLAIVVYEQKQAIKSLTEGNKALIKLCSE